MCKWNDYLIWDYLGRTVVYFVAVSFSVISNGKILFIKKNSVGRGKQFAFIDFTAKSDWLLHLSSKLPWEDHAPSLERFPSIELEVNCHLSCLYKSLAITHFLYQEISWGQLRNYSLPLPRYILRTVAMGRIG